MRIKNCDLRDFFWCASLALALAAAAQPGALGQSKAARSAASQDARTRSSEDGNQAYTTNCAGCHGLDGKGGERAPDIATRPHARQLSDAAILSILRTGVPNTAMPSFRFLTPAIRKSLVAHLRTLQGAGTGVALAGDASRGKALFFGKAACAKCHMVQGQGGFFGSDLTDFAGGRSPEAIRAAIVSPNRDLDPRHRILIATLPGGELLEGIARNEDNFSLQLLTPDGRIHLLNKASLAALVRREESPMPDDYAKVLSSNEMDDLVKFLASTARSRPAAKRVEDSNEE